MPVKTEKELNETQRSHWLKAVEAIERQNFGYAVSLLQGILKQEPQFLAGRQLLRRVEVKNNRSNKRSFFNISSVPLAMMKAQREIKKDPKRAVEMSEKVLEEEPYHRQANLVLKEAAIAAGWPEIGIFALQTLLEENACDLKVLRLLGRLYHDLGESERELEVYNRIVEIDPLDADASRLFKDASARASMKAGGWTEAESYRDLIRDKDLVVSLEQQERMTLSGSSIDQQIAEVYGRHKAEPQSVDHARKLGAFYEQKEDFENSIAWFQYAVDLTGRSDPTLLGKVSDLKMKLLEREMTGHEEFLAVHGPEHGLYLERCERLSIIRKRRGAILVEDARQQANRNPSDPRLRFELGRHLLDAGLFRDALPQLQRARQNPNVRLKAMNLLGRCYRELGMLDLAARQLEEAAKEIFGMDEMKKEIIYDLGLIYEQAGDAKKSIICMKQIYETDYGFKDVAARVEKSYR